MPDNAITYGGTTYSFVSIQGLPDIAGESLKRIEKAGASGYAFKSMGYHAEPSQLIITSLSVPASFSTAWATYKALQGKQVVLWTPQGISISGVVIERWKVESARREIGAIWNGTIWVAPYRLTSSVLVTYPYGYN